MSGALRLPSRWWWGPARSGLPTACLWLALLVACPAVAQQITGADYAAPTRAYPHGALGDDLEWAVVRITVSREKGADGALFSGNLALTYDIKPPSDTVFEDTAPRLWDVDGDGKPEVVVVISHQAYGAQLAVIAYRRGELEYIAATPMIGKRFRWLAPVGAGDLDGDGYIEVAFIHTPHLSKTLHIWRYRDGEFTRVARQPGLTNHRIGWDHIPGGLRRCGGPPELVTANGDWSRIIATRLVDGVTRSRDIAPYNGPDSLNAALECP